MLKDAITCPLLRCLIISFIGFSIAVLASGKQRGMSLDHDLNDEMKSHKGWSEIVECPNTGFADSFALKSLVLSYGYYAITGIKVGCYVHKTSERKIVSDSLVMGHWQGWKRCTLKRHYLKRYMIHAYFGIGYYFLRNLWMQCYQAPTMPLFLVGNPNANSAGSWSDFVECAENTFVCGAQLQKALYFVPNVKFFCCKVGMVLRHRLTGEIQTLGHWEVIIQCPFPNLVKRFRVKAIKLSSGSYKITGIQSECESQDKFTGKIITSERGAGVWHPWKESSNENDYPDGYNVKFKSPPNYAFSWYKKTEQKFPGVLLNLHLTSNKGETWSGIVGSNDDGVWIGYLKCPPKTGVCGFQLLQNTRWVGNVQVVCCVF